ncbi:hypothetical protein B0H14DRAFT_2594264 [Mycena olivaceomarginata]|nr:hypothetical protein B0H14DRAFT_2594264 [Mycena olivaceomarginata]
MPTHSRSRRADSDYGTAPCGPLANIINFTQEIDCTSNSAYYASSGMNEVDGLLTAKDRQIADLINQAHAAHRLRKRRHHHRSEGIDNSQAPNPATVKERTRAGGQCFALLKPLFFVDDECVWAMQKVALQKAIWLHSPDTQLQATANTTHIKYSTRLSEYLGQLVEGLRSQADWAEGLLKYWKVLFPDCSDFNNEEPTGDRLAESRTIYSSSFARSGWPFDTSPPLIPTPFTDVVPPLLYWSNIGFNSMWRCEGILALGRLP